MRGISLISSWGVGKHYVVVCLVYELNLYNELNYIEMDIVILNRTFKVHNKLIFYLNVHFLDPLYTFYKNDSDDSDERVYFLYEFQQFGFSHMQCTVFLL